MEDKMITLTREKIAVLYNESRILLLEQSSYHEPVDTLNVNLYFTFLEAALKQPYNRLTSLRAFLMDDDAHLTCVMYPFDVLHDDKRRAIDGKLQQAQKLVAALEVNEIDETGESLTEEYHQRYTP